MPGNSHDLNHPCNFAIEKIEAENLKPDSANRRWKDDRMALGSLTGERQGRAIIRMVAPAQPCLALFVVGDLLPVLRRSLRVQPVLHLKRA